jgi:hypothetical protein
MNELDKYRWAREYEDLAAEYTQIVTDDPLYLKPGTLPKLQDLQARVDRVVAEAREALTPNSSPTED